MRLTRKRTEQDILAFIMERGTVTMSQRAISNFVGHSSSTVARALLSLEKRGLIQVEKSNITSKPDTITYIGSRKVKRSITEVINNAMTILRDIMDAIVAGKKVIPVDEEIPEGIDKSKVILCKKMPNVQGYLIIVKQ